MLKNVKFRCLIILLALSLCFTGTCIAGSSAAEALTLNGSAYVPLRQVCEQLGFSVWWDGDTYTAYAGSDAESAAAYPVLANDGIAVLHDGRTFVDINSLAENHGIYYAKTSDSEYTFMLPDKADTAAMMETIRRITETHRPFGGEDIIRTRDYIIATMKEYGYDISIQKFDNETGEASFINEEEMRRAGEAEFYSDGTEIRTETGYNIIASKAPRSLNKTTDILIISAHYDSVMFAPGANDNGSGVSVFLETAKLLKDFPSDTEVRFVAFDGEEDGLIGSYYYVNNFTDDELSRIVGAINFDMFASDEVEDISIETWNGESNFLTDMFEEYTPGKEPSSDHASFASAMIDAFCFSHERDTVYHSPNDTIEHIDPSKLYNVAEMGIKAVTRVISDATSSYQKPAPTMKSDYPLSKIDASEKIKFHVSRQEFEEKHGIETIQIPSKMSRPMDITTTHVSIVDWWGQPAETHFKYSYDKLASIIIKIDDIDAVTKALDNSLPEVTQNIDNYFLSGIDPNEVGGLWTNNRGIAFSLIERDGQPVIAVTYCCKHQIFDLSDSANPLAGREKQAWDIIKPLLEQSGLIEYVTDALIQYDGYGDDSLYGMFYTSKNRGVIIALDPDDILDEAGALYNRDDLLYAFAFTYAVMTINHDTQKNITHNEAGERVDNGFSETSFFAQYSERFYPQRRNEYEISEEMYRAVAAYATGDNRDEIDTEKIEFFSELREFDKIKGIK